MLNPIKSKNFRISSFFVVTAILLSVISGFFMGFATSFRLVFGLIYLTILPGLIWSFIILPHRKMDYFERAITSIVLSIVFVPLPVYLFSRIGIKINPLNVFLEILLLIIAGIIILMIKNKKHDQKPEA